MAEKSFSKTMSFTAHVSMELGEDGHIISMHLDHIQEDAVRQMHAQCGRPSASCLVKEEYHDSVAELIRAMYQQCYDPSAQRIHIGDVEMKLIRMYVCVFYWCMEQNLVVSKDPNLNDYHRLLQEALGEDAAGSYRTLKREYDKVYKSGYTLSTLSVKTFPKVKKVMESMDRTEIPDWLRCYDAVKSWKKCQ